MKRIAIHILLSAAFFVASGVSQCPAQGAEIASWQSFNDPSSSLSVQYPQNWKASLDAKTGRIDIVDVSGAALSILPFSIAGKTIESLNPKEFFSVFVKALLPGETWSAPTSIGPNGFHSTYANASASGSAALVVQNTNGGVTGLVCAAKLPKTASGIGADTFAKIMSTVRPKQMQGGSKELPQSNQSAQNQQFSQAADDGDEDDSPAEAQNGGQFSGGSAPGGVPSNIGWTRFTDPSEGSFTVDVPQGWTVTGGLTRVSALDVRPWVKAVSPDQLVTAFIGDGKLSPCTMPTSSLITLGFPLGSNYNGTVVQNYIPARQFAEKYAKSNLGSFLSNLRVVEEHDHPEIAAAVNGTTGATKSEAATIKLTGMYGNLPAIAYYLAVTKATVAYGTGMWWVTKVAGAVGPAQRDAEALGVILHMLGSFQIDQAWSANSLRNTAAVSQHYRAVSQQVSNSISNRYWSQQAHHDRMNQAYWNRQASQDRAANNFSNYIRGVENVQDPNTGTKYQVQYGPQGHFIDSGQNYIYSGDHAPGPDWQQLMSVP